jgi:zinc transport system substrate-binding protein
MTRLALAIALAAFLVLSAFAGCSTGSDASLSVVTSTSMLESVVEQIGGDLIDVVNIIPPAQCPGHFDVGAGDIRRLAEADLFFMHGWQGEKFTQELIDSADNPDLVVAVINVEGNWMTPPVQLQAADKVLEELCRIDGDNCSAYEEAATAYKSTIEAKGDEIEARIASANLPDVNVMCADMQAGFVNWLGLNLVQTYGRPESFTPQVLMDLVDTGRESNVTLVIDNLQSGKDAGAALAEDLDCTRVILTNFPGGFDNTETWEKAIDHNVDLILQAVAD